MKAIVLYGKEDVRLADFPVKPVGAGEVRIAVSYCGVCGSDVHKYFGKKNTHPVHYPVPLGHEISGRIAEVGEGVTEFKPGDPVTADPNWSCGSCYFCRRGLPHFCTNARGVIKGMAEYVTAPVENVYLLPEGMDLRTAALTEPVSCCLHGLDQLEVRTGDHVALIGYGAIGRIMLQLLRHSGPAEITVVDMNAELEADALRQGADHFIHAGDEESLKALGDKGNISRVIECVGHHSAQQTSLLIAGRGATVVFFGVNDEVDILPFSPYKAFLKELVIRTSFVNPRTTERAIAVLASGIVDMDAVIGKVVPMEQVPELFRENQWGGTGKTLVKIG